MYNVSISFHSLYVGLAHKTDLSTHWIHQAERKPSFPFWRCGQFSFCPLFPWKQVFAPERSKIHEGQTVIGIIFTHCTHRKGHKRKNNNTTDFVIIYNTKAFLCQVVDDAYMFPGQNIYSDIGTQRLDMMWLDLRLRKIPAPPPKLHPPPPAS